MSNTTKIKVIGLKFNSKDENWRKVLKNPEQYVDIGRLGRKAFLVRKKIEKAMETQRISLAWSGGKDSMVLHHILRGLPFSLIQFVTLTELDNLYFPGSKEWLDENLPEGLEKFDLGLSLEQISKIIFPKGATGNKCWLAPKWRVFRRNQKKYQLDWTLFGRRLEDGNKVMGEKFVSQEKMRTWCPILDWTNEEVAAYIATHNIPLPPDYDCEDGFRLGLRVWPLTNMKEVERRWPEIIGKQVTPDGKLIL